MPSVWTGGMFSTADEHRIANEVPAIIGRKMMPRKKKTQTASFRFDNHYGNTENIYVLKSLHLRHLVMEPFAFDNKDYLRRGTENPNGRNINNKRGETLTFSPKRKTTKTRELFTFCFPEC